MKFNINYFHLCIHKKTDEPNKNTYLLLKLISVNLFSTVSRWKI